MKQRNNLKNILALGLFVFSLPVCAVQEGEQQSPRFKNLILMIGDGMGPQQIGLLETFLGKTKIPDYQGKVSALSRFAQGGQLALSMTWPANALVVDSACSATQLAAGVDSGSEMIGLDAQGNIVKSILEQAKDVGKATGLVSDARITHATPAAFAAHQRHRSLENDIALQMLTGNQVDIMLSGGLRHWLPASVNDKTEVKKQLQHLIAVPGLSLYSKRQDEQNLIRLAQQQGYTTVFNRQQLQQAGSNKIVGLFASSAMQDALSVNNGANAMQPSLADMTVKALQRLQNNENGFFLMVEGGQIDWAGHANDAGWLLHEMLRFDAAVRVVYDWVKDRNDTLVVITADHETGGFGFSYSRNNIPEAKGLPGEMFQGHLFHPRFNFGNNDIPDKLYMQKRNFKNIWAQAKQKTGRSFADNLLQSVNENSVFKINKKQVAEILATEKNDYRVAGHSALDRETFPKIHDFKEFYVYGDIAPLNLLGRQLAKGQNVVWASGTHTHTPVPVIVWGGGRSFNDLPGFTHHSDVGKWMSKMLVGVPEDE